MKKLAIIIGVLAVLLIILILLRYHKRQLLLPTAPESQNQGSTSKMAVEKAKVIHIFDGDSIEIEGGKRIRLIGIDTPELDVKENTPDCFATESAKITKQLLENQIVELEKDKEDTDKYGRLLRYVYTDGVFINEFLLQQGYGRRISIPPNTRYWKELDAAEKEAKEGKRGLWGKCRSDI